MLQNFNFNFLETLKQLNLFKLSKEITKKDINLINFLFQSIKDC